MSHDISEDVNCQFVEANDGRQTGGLYSTAMNGRTASYGQFARHSNENSSSVRLNRSGAINTQWSKGALVRTERAGGRRAPLRPRASARAPSSAVRADNVDDVRQQTTCV